MDKRNATKYRCKFLGHTGSRRLQWPIVITRCPSSVVCRLSVHPSVRQFTFSTSSPELFYGFWWNLVWMKYSRSLTRVVVFWPDPPRAGQNRSRGGGPLLQRTSSSDRKATATNRMHSSDLEAFGKKCSYFGFIRKSNFWRVFDVFFGLSHFCVF